MKNFLGLLVVSGALAASAAVGGDAAPAPERVYFLSHRGESDDAPENTLAAFQLAMDRDSDGIELDVRLTADKQVVCIHDGDLKRVAGCDAVVHKSTYEELRKHHPVPLLKDVWKILKPGVILQIELKGSAAVLPVLAAEIPPEAFEKFRVRFSSFQPALIKAAAKYFPTRTRLLLLHPERKFKRIPANSEVIAMLKECQATGCSLRATDKDWTVSLIQELKANGYECVAWGINNRLGLFLADHGVSSMTCNHAVALRELWRKHVAEQKK